MLAAVDDRLVDHDAQGGGKHSDVVNHGDNVGELRKLAH